jgi:hypothetical protein
VFFDGATSEYVFRFFPNGVDAPEVCDDVLLSGAQINEISLKNILDRIHAKSLVTPTVSLAAGKLWEDSSKCHPVEQAEKEIQSILQVALAHALGSVQVKYEGTGGYGRYDLLLQEQDPVEPSKFSSVAILELKVVKAFTSTGKKYADSANQTAVLKGLIQAFAYREEHGSGISALCCYDMRPNPDLHEHAANGCKRASDLGVKLWAWPLRNSAEAARIALAADYLAKPGKQDRRPMET